jgi:hypothetical protein
LVSVTRTSTDTICSSRVSGPRTRAPLGVKTTNAKGQAFQTPGLAQPTKKPDETKRPLSTRKSVKSKIIVAPVERAEADLLVVEEDDVPDIEYAPPPPVDLPDPPEVFEYDQSFPQFKGSNICRGFGEIYLTQPTDEHGVPLSFREYEEKCAQYDKEVERQVKESLDQTPDLGTELDKKVDAIIAAGPRRKEPEDSRVDTVRARRAADALSHSKVAHAAMKPTTSSLQKPKKATFSVLNSRNLPSPSNPSPMRHVAAEVVSKNTIGFPKARHAPSIVPPRTKQPTSNTETTSKSPINQLEIHPARFRELYGNPPEGSDMWIRLRQHEMSMEDVVEHDVAGDWHGTNFFASEEDDGEVFQLPMPS